MLLPQFKKGGGMLKYNWVKTTSPDLFDLPLMSLSLSQRGPSLALTSPFFLTGRHFSSLLCPGSSQVGLPYRLRGLYVFLLSTHHRFPKRIYQCVYWTTVPLHPQTGAPTSVLHITVTPYLAECLALSTHLPKEEVDLLF